jgi:hypothetical protein
VRGLQREVVGVHVVQRLALPFVVPAADESVRVLEEAVVRPLFQ